jgi:hypothetical protein
MSVLQMLSKLMCRVFGHAGPKEVPYKEGKPIPRMSGNASLTRIEWDCPRCGQNTWALKTRPDPVQRTPAAHHVER